MGQSGLDPKFRQRLRKKRVEVPNFTFNNCLLLDDVNDFATINVGAGAGQMPTVARNGCFSAWGYFDNTTNAAFFTWGTSATNRLAFSTNLGSQLFIFVNSTAIFPSPTLIPVATSWNHYLLNWTDLGASVRYDLYVDAQFIGTVTSAIFPSGSTVFRLGTVSPTGVDRPFGGRMDEVLVYNRPLDNLEILTLFGAGYGTRHIPGNGLLARWPMDETTGTTATDFSGNSRTLSLVNGPTFIDHFTP